MARTGHFVHGPIKESANEIRLVQLKLGNSTRIELNIRHVSLVLQEPSYKALSYEWGAKRPIRNVFIEGRPIAIRENLWQFLDTLRQHPGFDCQTWLWCDQLCIQQDVLEERNHQVALMGKIYDQAEEVMAWLGPSAHDSDEGIDLLSSSGELPREPNSDDGRLRIAHLRRLFNSNELGHSTHEVTVKSHSQANHYNGAIALLKRRYWTRLWIVQECMLARRLSMWCGSRKFPARIIRSLAATVQSDSIILMLTPRRQLDLWEALLRFSKLECENPLDKVYGLLGFVRTASRLPVDYNITMEELFGVVVATLMAREAHYIRADFLERAVQELAENMGIDMGSDARSCLMCCKFGRHFVKLDQHGGATSLDTHEHNVNAIRQLRGTDRAATESNVLPRDLWNAARKRRLTDRRVASSIDMTDLTPV